MAKQYQNPCSINFVRDILRSEDLRAKKNLGQNFLVSDETVNEIIDFAQISKTETVSFGRVSPPEIHK